MDFSFLQDRQYLDLDEPTRREVFNRMVSSQAETESKEFSTLDNDTRSAVLDHYWNNAPQTEPEPEQGFFSNVLDLAGSGFQKLKTGMPLAADVAGGEFSDDAPEAIHSLLTENGPQPKELKSAVENLSKIGADWEEAKGFMESAGVVGRGMLAIAKEAVTNPKGLAYISAEQVANMAPSIAGMLAGGKLGALGGAAAPVTVPVGAFLGGMAGGAAVEMAIETAGFVDDALKELGLDATEENIRALLSDPDEAEKIISQSRKKAAGTAATDAALTLIGGKIAISGGKGISRMSRAGRIAGGAAVDITGEGISDAVGQEWSKGKVDMGDVALETFAGVGGAAPSLAGAARALGGVGEGKDTGGGSDVPPPPEQVQARLAAIEEGLYSGDIDLETLGRLDLPKLGLNPDDIDRIVTGFQKSLREEKAAEGMADIGKAGTVDEAIEAAGRATGIISSEMDPASPEAGVKLREDLASRELDGLRRQWPGVPDDRLHEIDSAYQAARGSEAGIEAFRKKYGVYAGGPSPAEQSARVFMEGDVSDDARTRTKAELEPDINKFLRRDEKHLAGAGVEIEPGETDAQDRISIPGELSLNQLVDQAKERLKGVDSKAAVALARPILDQVKRHGAQQDIIEKSKRAARDFPELQKVFGEIIKPADTTQSALERDLEKAEQLLAEDPSSRTRQALVDHRRKKLERYGKTVMDDADMGIELPEIETDVSPDSVAGILAGAGEVSIDEAKKEKAKLKSQVIEGVKSGKFQGAVRFGTVDEIRAAIEKGELPVSEEYGQIHATPILGRDDDMFAAYGAYDKHNMAMVIPSEYVQAHPDAATKEVIIKKGVPLDAITFLIDGHERAYTYQELKEELGRAKADLIGEAQARQEAQENTFVNNKIQKINEFVNRVTGNGTRPMNINWETKAVKRFIEAELPQFKGSKLAGQWASAKIAAAKARTFDELKSAIAKITTKKQATVKAKPATRQEPVKPVKDEKPVVESDSIKVTQKDDIVSRVDSAINDRKRSAIFIEEGTKAFPEIRMQEAEEAGRWAYLVAKGEVTQAEFDAWKEQMRKEGRTRPVKEPWEMTIGDYVRQATGGVNDPDAVSVAKFSHAKHVKQAVATNQDVPLNVLKEYKNNEWAQIAIERKGGSAPEADKVEAKDKDVWDVFAKTTDMPLYDDMLKNTAYHERVKGRTTHIEMMTPDEYLEMQAKAKGVTLEEDLKHTNRNTIEKIKESMRTGERKIHMLSIEADKQYQEGRHRAIAAKELGLSKVPVQIVEPFKKPVMPTEKGFAERTADFDASPAKEWIISTFGEDFTSTLNKASLADFLEGKTTYYEGGDISPKWFEGAEKAYRSIGVEMDESFSLEVLKEAYLASKKPPKPTAPKDTKAPMGIEDELASMDLDDIEALFDEVVAEKEAEEQPKAEKVKEPWEMTRGDYYQHIRKTEGAGASNSRPKPDFDTLKKEVGFDFVVKNGNEIQPTKKATLSGGFSGEQEAALKTALAKQGFSASKVRVRNQEEQSIPNGMGWRANSRDSFPTSPEHERSVRKAISEGKPVPPEVLKSYPDLQQSKAEERKPIGKNPRGEDLFEDEKGRYTLAPSGFKTYETKGAERRLDSPWITMDERKAIVDSYENDWDHELTPEGRRQTAKAIGWNARDGERISKTLWRHLSPAAQHTLINRRDKWGEDAKTPEKPSSVKIPDGWERVPGGALHSAAFGNYLISGEPGNYRLFDSDRGLQIGGRYTDPDTAAKAANQHWIERSNADKKPSVVDPTETPVDQSTTDLDNLREGFETSIIGSLRERLGDKLSPGKTVTTNTGRKTTPFPEVKTGKINSWKTVKNIDKWLVQNAVDEAVSRGDDFNKRQFEQDLGRKNIPMESKEMAVEYLFGDYIPPVIKSPLKDMVSPKAESPKTLTPADILKNAAQQGVKGLDEVTKGLYELFGGGALKSGVGGFDAETYAKAKPHFEAGFQSFVAAGKSMKDFVRWVVDSFGRAAKPYLVHWAGDKKSGLTTDEKGPNIDSERGDKDAEQIREDGEGVSEGSGTGEIPGTEEGEIPEPVLPGPGGTGVPGERKPGGGRDAGRRGERGSDQGSVDYTITNADGLGKGGPKQKYRDNLAAIRLIKSIGDRQATPEEQSILVKYVGWGGLPQAFPRPDGSISTGWDSEVNELRGILSDEEYTAARRSTQDAHYTSQTIIKGVYAALKRFGFKRGKILEPSVGTGNFIGLMPKGVRSKSNITGIELEPITAAIAKQLYPEQRILQSGFQDIFIAPGSFDAAVGNPPFGDQKLFDPENTDLRKFSIHNFFFAKSLKGLRENGILAMVVSSSMMDKVGTAQREWLNRHAELIGAIRLPNNAFKENALTEVTTDIIFLRKRAEGEQEGENLTGAAWTELKQVPGQEHNWRVNEYFAEHPEMMLGDLAANKLHPAEVVDGVYNAVPGMVARKGVDLDKALTEAVERLPEGIFKAGKAAAEVQDPDIIVSDPGFAQPYGYTLDDSGRAVRRLPDRNGEQRYELATYGDQPISGNRLERFKALLQLRDDIRKLIRAEVSDNPKMDVYRKHLNKHYDAFVEKYGYISAQVNSTILKHDPADLPLLRSLEKNYSQGVSEAAAKKTGISACGPSAEKSSVFSKRTRMPYVEATHAETVKDGLAISLRERGVVDVDHIAKLTGKTEAEVVKGLEGLAFLDPDSDTWETADVYLSGNVKKKLKAAESAAGSDNAYKVNVEALKKVIPEDVPPDLIHFRVGASWFPTDFYEDFAQEKLGSDMDVRHLEDLGVWVTRINNNGTSEFDTDQVSGAYIFNRMVKGQDVLVYYKDENGTRRVDRDASAAAQERAGAIDRAFQDWVLGDGTRRDILAKNFNDKINVDVKPKFDGSHMVFPGMGIINANAERDDQMRTHQKSAIWRLIQKGRGLLDHVVGSGKTFAAIATGLELKRMGLIKKPMYVVPNHLVPQWTEDFQKLYPGANVLAIGRDDFSKANRQEFLARIATGDWDAVLVAHSSFGFIRMPADYEMRFYQEQLDQLEEAMKAMAEEGGSRMTVKQMEKTRDRMRARMDELANRPIDAVVDFSELGVDAVFIDEAHEFKNLFYATKRSRIAGLSNSTGSKKAFDMFVKTQYILETNNGRGVFFMTGTPVSNSIAEMYTMMRYMDYKRLKEMGAAHFDQWANIYASAVSDWEIDPTGTRYRYQTKMDFVNVPGMTAFYNDFADVVSTADLKRIAAEAGQIWPIPDVKGGKPTLVVAERSELQKNFSEYIVHRFDHMPKDPKEDNPLKATGEAMKAALDIRLIREDLPDHPGSKVNLCINNIMGTYHKWNAKKGTQLVFCDLSVPKGARDKHIKEIRELRQKLKDLEQKMLDETNDEKLSAIEEEYTKVSEKFERFTPSELMAADSNFSVYDDVKAKLIAQGIPAHEIAFIHDANTDKQKADLFNRVRSGRVRVLIGSTSKMGAGMNVQDKLVALHHLDAPWRPSDLEQREGRIIRQGNELFEEALQNGEKFEIEIFRYATKETLDTRRWQVIERKARSIEQFRKGDCQWGQKIEDAVGEASNAAEMKAAASGNPLILEEIQLRKQLDNLDSLKRSKRAKRFQYEKHISSYKEYKHAFQGILDDIDADAELVLKNPRDNTPQGWKISVDGQEFRAEGLKEVPKETTSEDKDEIKANKKAIKDAEEHNHEALKNAKERFEKVLSDKTDKLKAKKRGTNGPTILFRGVEFTSEVIGRGEFRFTGGFKAEGEHLSRTTTDLSLLEASLSGTGILARLNNILENVVNERGRSKDNKTLFLEWSKGKAREAEEQLSKLGDDNYDAEIDEKQRRHSEVLAELKRASANQQDQDFDYSMWGGPSSMGGGRTSTASSPAAPEAPAEAPAETSAKYYRFVDEGGKRSFVPVPDAESVEIVPWFETFIYHDKKLGQWTVAERTSGASIAWAPSEEAAIEKAARVLESNSEERMKQLVADFIEMNGSPPSPQYSAKIAPGKALELADIQDIFRGYPLGRSANDKSVWIELPSGTLRIKTVQRIAEDKAAFEVAHKRKRKPYEDLVGKYLDSKIEIHADLGDKYTLVHELEHFAEDIGLLTNGEIFAINRALREEGKEANAENRADWVEEHLYSREMDRKTRKGRIIQKIEDFIGSLVNLFTKTTGGVLRTFESGKLFGRQGKKGSGSQVSLFSMAGPRAKGADTGLLAKAKAMKEQGGMGREKMPLFQTADANAAGRRIADKFNEQYPGYDVRYDGVQDMSPLNKPDLYQFTIYGEGSTRGATFLSKTLSVEGVKDRVDDMVRKRMPQYSVRVVRSEDPKVNAKADALLKKLLAVFPKGVPDAKKTLRALNRYEDLAQTLRDDKKDIYEKQKALEDHVREELPLGDRGRALHLIKFISRPVTAAGREKMLQRAIDRVNEIHEKVEKARNIKAVRKLLKPRKRAHKKGVASHEGLSIEAQGIIKEIREVVKMSDEEAAAEIEALMRALDQDYSAPLSERQEDVIDETETARRLAVLQTFSGLKGKSASDVELARDMLVELLKSGRLELSERIKAEREERKELREMAVETITGGQGIKSGNVERLENAQHRQTFWGRIKDKLRSFDDMHQSYEFLLDKLSRFDTGSDTLESDLTKRYARMTFDATENEQAGVQACQNLLVQKLSEIWGVKGAKLGRVLRKNSTLQKKTGVTQATEKSRVEIPLSQNQAYKLWQMFQQPTIREEMQSQGYDIQTLMELEQFIDPKIKQWAQWQIDEFYPNYRNGVNDIFKDLFYTDMPKIENYSPISRVYYGKTEDEAMLTDSGFFASVVPGALYSRKNNARDFNILDGDTVLLKHIVDLEHFKAWGKPMREIRSVLGSEPVQRAIKQYHGRTANQVFQQFHNDFASGGKNNGQSLQLLDTIRANFTRAVIGANPVVFLKQLSSIPAYTMDIPVKDFAKGFAYALMHPVEAHKTLMESNTMQARYRVGFERDIILAMQRDVPKTITGQVNISDLLMLSTKLGDKLAIIAGGWSVYAYHLKKLQAKGMSRDAAHKEALHQFDRATKRSQQAGDTIDLGYIQRSWGSIGKLFTMFMTAPTSYYRSTSAGVRNIVAKRGGANVKRLLVSWPLLSMLFQFVADGFDWEPEKQAKAALLGPLNGLFIVRDLVGTMSAALFEGVTYWTAGAPPPLTTANLGAQAMARTNKMIKEGMTDEDFAKTMFDLAEFAGNLTGIPVGPLERVWSGMRDAATGETEHPIRRSMGFSENALGSDD